MKMRPLLAGLGCGLLACRAEQSTVVSWSGVQTLAATEIMGVSATLVGTINPGGEDTQAWFEWSTDPMLAQAAVTQSQPMGSGIREMRLTASVTGLEPGGTYHYRAVATNAGGRRYGSTLILTTPRPPSVRTLEYHLAGGNPTNVVGGVVTPNRYATVAWLEYDTDSAFRTFERSAIQEVGSGDDRVEVSVELPLRAFTRYFARWMASNVGGQTAGNVTWFTTGGPPDIASSGHFPTTACDAVNLYAYGVSNGAETRGWFEYSASPSMTGYLATPPQMLRLGATRPEWFGATVSVAGTSYFRAVVSNWLGTVRTSVETTSADICAK